MPRNRALLVAVLAVLIAGGLALRHYFAPEQVVRRRFVGAVEDFENERLLSVMSVVSREYDDGYGFTYDAIGGYLRETTVTFDALEVELEVRSVSETPDGSVELEALFVVTGVYEGRRGYVVGEPGESCRCVLRWACEDRGWMLRETIELHVPGYEDELARRAG